MTRKSSVWSVLLISLITFAFIVSGCAKRQMVKEEASVGFEEIQAKNEISKLQEIAKAEKSKEEVPKVTAAPIEQPQEKAEVENVPLKVEPLPSEKLKEEAKAEGVASAAAPKVEGAPVEKPEAGYEPWIPLKRESPKAEAPPGASAVEKPKEEIKAEGVIPAAPKVEGAPLATPEAKVESRIPLRREVPQAEAPPGASAVEKPKDEAKVEARELPKVVGEAPGAKAQEEAKVEARELPKVVGEAPGAKAQEEAKVEARELPKVVEETPIAKAQEEAKIKAKEVPFKETESAEKVEEEAKAVIKEGPREEVARIEKPREEVIASAPISINLSELRIQFGFDDYYLSANAKENLQKIASWMSKKSNVKIQIQGYTCEIGTDEYNLALGERRASSAKMYLQGLGVDPNKISTISYGKEKPLDPGHNEASRSKNRRDEFVEMD